MAYTKAYIYNTIKEAEKALNSINLFLGIPKEIDSITQSYTNFEVNNGSYIIKHDEIIEGVLGLPSDFEYIEIINPLI
jgi:hypothetical protein